MILCGLCLREKGWWDIRGDIVDYDKCPSCGHFMILYEVDTSEDSLKSIPTKVRIAPKFGDKLK